jgi:hypothetical protein
MTETSKEKLLIELPTAVKRELQEQAERQDISMRQAVAKAVREWLSRMRKRKDGPT